MKLNFWGPGKILELGWAVFMVELWNFKVTVNLGGYTLLYIRAVTEKLESDSQVSTVG